MGKEREILYREEERSCSGGRVLVEVGYISSEYKDNSFYV